MPHFYLEHFYVWGYAGFSLAAFLIACAASAHLVRFFPSPAIWILCMGVVVMIGSFCLRDVGWLAVSGGDGYVDGVNEPTRDRILDWIKSAEEIIQYAGVSLLAVALPLLARNFSIVRFRQTMKPEEADSSDGGRRPS